MNTIHVNGAPAPLLCWNEDLQSLDVIGLNALWVNFICLAIKVLAMALV